MSGIATAVVAGAAITAIISSNSASDAANTQAGAANNATATQWAEFQQQQQNQAPWQAAGAGALGQLSSMSQQTPSFTQNDFEHNQDPAYQFDLSQGQQAIQRSAAAQGSLMSGGTLKDLTNYSQGQASNEYGNAYNRFMTNQNTQFNRLASVAGLGQTANAQMGASGMNMANNVGNIGMSAGNAQAASQIAQGNIWGSTASGLGNSALQYGMMNRYAPNYNNPNTMPNSASELGNSQVSGSSYYSNPNPYGPAGQGLQYGTPSSGPSLLTG